MKGAGIPLTPASPPLQPSSGYRSDSRRYASTVLASSSSIEYFGRQSNRVRAADESTRSESQSREIVPPSPTKPPMARSQAGETSNNLSLRFKCLESRRNSSAVERSSSS